MGSLVFDENVGEMPAVEEEVGDEIDDCLGAGSTALPIVVMFGSG